MFGTDANMSARKQKLTLDLVERNDPILAGMDQRYIDSFDVKKASRHLSPFHLRRQGIPRLIVAQALLQIWANAFDPVRQVGDKRLGRPHLLNNDRFIAACYALDQYDKTQIKNAIEAYSKHCQTNPKRVNNPMMRKTFEAFLKDILETWVSVSQTKTPIEKRNEELVEHERKYRETNIEYMQLPASEQRLVLKQALLALDARGRDYGAQVISNPAVKAEIGRILQERSQRLIARGAQ